MCAFFVNAQSPTLKVSNLNFRTGNSEVSYIEFFVTNADVQSFRPAANLTWSLDFADFAEKWSVYEPQFKAKIENMNMAFLNNTPQKCVAKIVMSDKKIPQVAQQNTTKPSENIVATPILKSEEVVVVPQKPVVEKPTEVVKPLLTPQESWENARKEYVNVDLALLEKEKMAMKLNSKESEIQKAIAKEKDKKKVKLLNSELERYKSDNVSIKGDIVALVSKKAEMLSTIQALEQNNNIQVSSDENKTTTVTGPVIVTASLDSKLDVTTSKPSKLDVPVVKPVIKPLVKEVAPVTEISKTKQVEATKTPQTPSKVVVENTIPVKETKVENIVMEMPKETVKVISDVSTSTISSSPMIEVVKKKHLLRDCPDLELDSIWLAGVSKKWITVNAIVRNNSTNPQNMYGSTRFDDDNVAIRFYINSTENLTRGAIAGDGEYILGVLDKESGILQSDQTIKYTAKFSGEQRTKLTPFIIAELNPFGMTEECNPKNNYKSLKIEE